MHQQRRDREEILQQQARDKKDILQRLDQQVQSLVKQHEQARTEAKADRTRLVTLQATVKEMCHEQSKIKGNEHAEKDTIHAQIATGNKQMMALTDEVMKLREAHITPSKATTAMEQRFRNEMEKLRNNERSQNATFQGEFERSFQEFRASLADQHTELESLKLGEHEERTKMEEQLCEATATLKTTCKERMEELRQEIEQIIEAESRGNTTFEQSMEENLADSTVKIHQLRKEFEQFKNNQLEKHTGQQANSLLGQMVEKLGQMVEQQTGFFGTMLPKLLFV